MKLKILIASLLVLAGAALIWAQASGRFDPASYTGDDSLGPTFYPAGPNTRWVASNAICYTPHLGLYMGISIQGTATCPGGQDIALLTRWLYPDQSSFDIQAEGWMTVPESPVGSGPLQHSWIGYQNCVNAPNPVMYTECLYGCDGDQYPGQCYP